MSPPTIAYRTTAASRLLGAPPLMALVAGEDERAALRDLPEPLHADAKRRAVAIVEAKERRRPRKALTRSTADGSVPLTHDL